MDPQRFDELAKMMAARGSRRRFLARLAGVGTALGLTVAGAGEVAADDTPKPLGKKCRKDAQCASGFCDPVSRTCAASSATCGPYPVTLNDPGPPARVEITVQDTDCGLAEILVVRSANADTVVPPFTVGTTEPVIVTSTKIDQSQPATVEFRTTDLCGNVSTCEYTF
jgi:hypothetical protein